MRGVVFIFLLFLIPFFTFAQFGAVSAGATLSLNPSSTSPEPYQNVTLTINDYTLPGTTKTVTWKIDGKIQSENENKREISVTLGDIGTKTEVLATVIMTTGQTFSGTIVLEPSYIDIIVEPQTRTPSFFEGRSLPSAGSIINFTAVTTYDKLGPENLIYTWEVNDNILGGGAQRGKNKHTYSSHSYENSVKVNLRIEDLSGKVLGEKYLVFPLIEQKVLFYEISPLYGQKKRALRDGYTIVGNSQEIKAEPYYVDLRTYNNPGIVHWEIGGKHIENSNVNPYRIILSREGSGKESVAFEVRNLANLLQGAKGTLTVNY